MARIWFWLTLLILPTLAGCLPAVEVEVPPFHGRVVDDQHQPVANARVRITRADKEIGLLTTDQQGLFSRDEEAVFCLWPVPWISDVVWPGYVVGAHSDSARSKSFSYQQRVPQIKVFGIGRSTRVDVGDLVLVAKH